MAFIKYQCWDTNHQVNLAIIVIKDGYGMKLFAQLYFFLWYDSVECLKTHYDPRLPYTTSPATDDICERVLPIRRDVELRLSIPHRQDFRFAQ